MPDRSSFLLLLCLGAAPLAAQQAPAQQSPSAQQAPSAESSPVEPLELPTPTEVRTGSGAPGPGYSQQRAD
jgi:hypothetical protein